MDTLDLTGAAVGEVRQGIAEVRAVRHACAPGSPYRILELTAGSTTVWGWLWGENTALTDAVAQGDRVVVKGCVANAWDGSPRDLDIVEVKQAAPWTSEPYEECPDVIHLELERPLAALVQRALARELKRVRPGRIRSEALALCLFLHDILPQTMRTPVAGAPTRQTRHYA